MPDIFAACDLQSEFGKPRRRGVLSTRDGKVATVYASNLLTPDGEFGTSTSALAHKFEELTADAEVEGVIFHVSSPGGLVRGMYEAAASVAACARVKQVHSFIEDIGCSAAYWLASQARKVWSNPPGLVGSLGTYGVIYDYSAAAAQLGVKVHVISTGKHKGSGVPGTEISAETLAETQRRVNSLNEFFKAGVVKGRNMTAEKVAELFDGRVHVGKEALSLGLVDGVLLYNDFAAQFKAAFPDKTPKKVGSLMFSTEKQHGQSSNKFWSEVEARIQAGMSRQRAISEVVAREPDLHKQMLEEVNQRR